VIHKNCLIFFIFLFSAVNSFALHIVIDPGHGGIDRGAVRGAIKESEIALSVSKMLRNLLIQNPHFQVTLTREIDQTMSLKRRVEVANSAKADLFLSLHANAADDPRAKGLEFFIQNNLPPSEESLFQAAIENQLLDQETEVSEALEPSKKGDLIAIVEDLKRQYRVEASLKASQIFQKNLEEKQQATIKQAPFYVISKTQVPSVLVELGFITNPRESRMLTDLSYQQTLSQKIYDSLVEYKEKVDKTSREQLQ
jgi:N-acetylmuramoyl-L-alanine amidase